MPQINKLIRDSLVLNLRRAFTIEDISSPIYQYRYVETYQGEYDFENTKVLISTAIPLEHAKYPMVIVDTISMKETRYLGDTILETKQDGNNVDISDTQCSSLDCTLSINVYALDTIVGDELTDLVYEQLKKIRDDMADLGVEYKTMSMSPARRDFVDDRWFYVYNLNIDVYAESINEEEITKTVSNIDVSTSIGGS